MSEIILYPTETIYGLGVNPFDSDAVQALYELKGRPDDKPASWLVLNLDDIKRYAVVSEAAATIAERFLPGRITLVLPALSEIESSLTAADHTLSFRVSADPVAQRVIEDFMLQHNAPLTCTSANVSGEAPQANSDAILRQFGDRAQMITQIVDDGERTGTPSTVVRVVGDQIEILREGAISEAEIRSVVV